MKIIGLTGSIGMGKSTIGGMLERCGIRVHDSDQAVHDMFVYDRELIDQIDQEFPNVVTSGRVDRKALGKIVFKQPHKRHILEALTHPRVRQSQMQFLSDMRQLGYKAVALDIPLLFETGADLRCDIVLVVSAPAHIQRRRVLSRPGMTRAKFHNILTSQMPDHEKRQRADFVIETGLGFAHSLNAVRHILREIH